MTRHSFKYAVLIAALILSGSLSFGVEVAGLVSGATGVAAQISHWNEGETPAGFVACTNAATEIGATGVYYVNLTAAETNYDFGILKVTCNEAEAVIIPLNMELLGVDLDASTGTLSSNNFTSVSITYFPGDGTNQVTVNVVTSGTNAPIASAIVNIKNSGQTTTLARGTTDANGKFVSALDNGTYKVIISNYGMNVFTVPETLTVSGTTSDTYVGTSFDPDDPTTINVCLIYGWLYNDDGTPAAGKTVSVAVRPEDKPSGYDANGDGALTNADSGIAFIAGTSDTTDATGLFQLYVTYSARMIRYRDNVASKYLLTIDDAEMSHEFTAPSTSTAKLGSFVLTER
jgi:hypothetical protein